MDKKEIIKRLPRQFLDTVEQFNITDKQARNFGTYIKSILPMATEYSVILIISFLFHINIGCHKDVKINI